MTEISGEFHGDTLTLPRQDQDLDHILHFVMDQGELAHPRHYLFNQGASRPPAVIDIPVIQHK